MTTTYPTRVRIATAEDEEEVMSLCRDLHKENGLFQMNEDKVRDTLRKAFRREGGICGVIGDRGSIEALIYMMMSSFWYSNDTYIEELFAFVKKEYRKSRNAIDLLKFSKWCSESGGVPLVIGVISNERTAGKVRLYRREFSEPVGNFFYYNGK